MYNDNSQIVIKNLTKQLSHIEIVQKVMFPVGKEEHYSKL